LNPAKAKHILTYNKKLCMVSISTALIWSLCPYNIILYVKRFYFLYKRKRETKWYMGPTAMSTKPSKKPLWNGQMGYFVWFLEVKVCMLFEIWSSMRSFKFSN
jgi:hypothetical protein